MDRFGRARSKQHSDLLRLEDKELRRRIWNLQEEVASLERTVQTIPRDPGSREALQGLHVRLQFSVDELKKLTAEQARREGK